MDYKITLSKESLHFLLDDAWPSNRYSKLAAFAYILDKAADDAKLGNAGHDITVAEMAKKWNWSHDSVRHFIYLMARLGVFNMKHMGEMTCVTIAADDWDENMQSDAPDASTTEPELVSPNLDRFKLDLISVIAQLLFSSIMAIRKDYGLPESPVVDKVNSSHIRAALNEISASISK